MTLPIDRVQMRSLLSEYLLTRLIIEGFNPDFGESIDYETKFLRIYLSYKTAKDLVMESELLIFNKTELIKDLFFT